jgi:hypothetical protein
VAAGPVFVLPIIKYWMKDTNMHASADSQINNLALTNLEGIAISTLAAASDETKGAIYNNQELKS